jgi:ferritin-like metal-binding protein YciE
MKDSIVATQKDTTLTDQNQGLLAGSKKQYEKNAEGKESKEQKKAELPVSKDTPFEEMFADLLKDTYGAEKALLAALPDMSNAATTENLKEAFDDHLHVTKKHVARLEKIFGLMGKPAKAISCEAMNAMIEETKKGLEKTPEGSMTRDAFLIIAAQKTEHYEIAAYGSLVQIARTLEKEEIAMILEKTLNEEEHADQLLTDIAEADINPMADQEDKGEEADNSEIED